MFRTMSLVLMAALSSCIAAALVGCAPAIRTQPASSTQKMQVQIANPASENCVRQGGTLAIQKRGDDTDVGQSSYNNPFVYCAAVRTIDTPDGRYNGAKMPDSIVQAMIRQGIVSADGP